VTDREKEAFNNLLENPSPWTAYRKIWERDLLELAHENPRWRDIAILAGFTDEKIDTPWTHKDEGKLIDLPEVKTVYIPLGGQGPWKVEEIF
jgi:hypothetical protein